ncbi:MAG: heme-binding domain-containing protein [Melioribacteraceae bacterium]|nr:heme-binding domain-containing protein [Melioribacteraceae bacterium]
MFKKIIIVVVLILVAIQFITIDQTNPPADMSKDFISITNPPSDLASVIKSSCYDCHSHHTKYPWYSDVAPASWLIKEHINNGRNHLNFSVWTDYKEKKKDHKLEECIDMIKSGEMPMEGYVMFHAEAEINHEQKMQLISWFTELRDSL